MKILKTLKVSRLHGGHTRKHFENLLGFFFLQISSTKRLHGPLNRGMSIFKIAFFMEFFSFVNFPCSLYN